jgi:ribonuclease HI
MKVPTPQITIYTDSSETGWGISSPFIETFGFWSETDKTHSINVRELKAVYYALKIHATRFANCTIKVFTDNTTA